MSDPTTNSNGDLFDVPVSSPKKRAVRSRKTSEPESTTPAVTAETKVPRRSKPKQEASPTEPAAATVKPAPKKRVKALPTSADEPPHADAPEVKTMKLKKAENRASTERRDAAIQAPTAATPEQEPMSRVRRALQSVSKDPNRQHPEAASQGIPAQPQNVTKSIPVMEMEPRGIESPRVKEPAPARHVPTEPSGVPPKPAHDERRLPERHAQAHRNATKHERHSRAPHPQRHDPRKSHASNRFERPANKHAAAKMRKPDPDAERANAVLEGPKLEVEGLLEITPKGSGFLRKAGKQFEQGKDDVFVPAGLLQRFGIRAGVWLKGFAQMGSRGEQLVEIVNVNGLSLDDARKLPHFDELRAINPTKRIPFETESARFTTRVLDLIAPVGRGQRGLIVSPPRSGKTTLLLHIAESIRQREDDSLHLMILLVDERPEEVTEFRRALPGVELYASSNDENARNHCRIAELAIERAKRLVESGKHVFLLMDSITRLARAYNQSMSSGPNHHRGVGSGGIMVGALEAPRRLFAAARNTSDAGSLTILATALIQTNSRADDAIFQEFKGTGNMEIVLDRKIAEQYIYPAVDIFKSGTRREELLLPEHMLHKINMIRRGLSGHKPLEAMERLTFFLKKFASNAQMLLEIKG